ncbi:hypothetical protein F4809DRAFT_404286 [Biscogniauxia mediterranea]|nr:hypothetical protein F4809DRAFT_404286 [Biscogniauxia mediterranea]
MTSINPPSPAFTCAENTALLYLLDPVPSPPAPNPISHSVVRQPGYGLPFEIERSLVTTLAYLSDTKDDPNHVPAVCVEEADSACLKVLLAVDKSSRSDGSEVLRRLERGFEGIFEVLRHADRIIGNNARNTEDEVLTAIVSMCSARILNRLRLDDESRAAGRRPINETLKQTVHFVEHTAKDQLRKLPPIGGAFLHTAKGVIRLVDAWSQDPTTATLQDLVMGIHRLWQVGDLDALLAIIPGTSLNPSSKKNLLRIVGKVSKYREIAKFLVREARKFPLVRRMKIVFVNPAQEAFGPLPADDYKPILPSVIARLNLPQGQQWEPSQVCQLLGVSEPVAKEAFTRQTLKTLREAKVHAEMQLLYYCDIKAYRLPPRVLCSSKDSCFLCNAFMLMHGKMHAPRCHGKLYPEWRLPQLPEFSEIERKFNYELENHIRYSLGSFTTAPPDTPYTDKMEATFYTPPPIPASTMSNFGLSRILAEEEKRDTLPPLPTEKQSPAEKLPVKTRRRAVSDSKIPLASRYIPRADAAEQRAKDDIGVAARKTKNKREASVQPPKRVPLRPRPSMVMEPEKRSPPPPPPSSKSSKSSHSRSSPLVRGRRLSETVEPNQVSPMYDAGALEVQIECARPRSISFDSKPRKLAYDIELLTPEEADKIRHQQGISMIDTEAMDGEISRAADDGSTCLLYLTAREAIVKIAIHRGPVEVGG